MEIQEFFELMAFYLDLLSTFKIIISLSLDYKFQEEVDMYLLEFFEPNLSYFERQMHDSMLLFNIIYILNSKYQIFGYKVSIDIFMVIGSTEYQLQYLHNHMYVVKL